jgi:glycine cleavage system H protein
LKIENCEFPDELLYDLEGGTWGRQTGDVFRLGVTSLISWSFGTLTTVNMKEEGAKVSKGEVVCSLEGSRHFDVIRSPVSGTVITVNSRLATEPELINKDPYTNGWILDLKLTDSKELHVLAKLPDASETIARNLRERHVRCFAAYPDLELFDIGVECAAVLVKLNEMIGNSSSGTVVHIISDDAKSEAEMRRWSEITGNSLVDSRTEGSFYHFLVRKK